MLILWLHFKMTWDFKCFVPTLSFAKELHSRAHIQGKKKVLITEPSDEGTWKDSLPSQQKFVWKQGGAAVDAVKVLITIINYNQSELSLMLHLIKSHRTVLPRGKRRSFAHLWSGFTQTFSIALNLLLPAGWFSIRSTLSTAAQAIQRKGQTELTRTGRAVLAIAHSYIRSSTTWSTAPGLFHIYHRSCHRGLARITLSLWWLLALLATATIPETNRMLWVVWFSGQ